MIPTRLVLVASLALAAPLPLAADEPAPPPLDATRPRAAAEVKTAQEAWAKHLRTAVEVENSIGIKLRLIPPGSYRRGSSPADVEAAMKLDSTFKKEDAGD